MNKASNVQAHTYHPWLVYVVFSAVIVMIASFDIFLPNLSIMRDYFKTNEITMQFSIILTPFISAFTGLIYGQLSDQRGRKPIFLLSLILLVVGSIVCAGSTHLSVFLLGRFIQALSAGGIMNVSLAILADIYKGPAYARYISIFGLLYPVVFAFSPNIGAVLGAYFSWRSGFILIAFLSLICFFFIRLYVEETLKNPQESASAWSIIPKVVHYLKPSPFLSLTIIHSLPVALSPIFTTNAAFLFIDVYGYTPATYAQLQLIPLFFSMLGALVYRKVILQIGFALSFKIGTSIMALFIILTILLCVFYHINTAVGLALMSLLNFSVAFIVSTAATQAFEHFTTDKGVGIAFVAMIRNLIISLSGMTVSLFYNHTSAPIFLGCAIICIAVIILYWMQKKHSSAQN